MYFSQVASFGCCPWLLIKVIQLFLNVITEEMRWASSIRKCRFGCGQALLPWKSMEIKINMFVFCSFNFFNKWIFQNYCMCKWDWLSLEWFSYLFAESVAKGFGLLPAVNQVLFLRTWTLCACLPEPHLRASSELSRTSSTTIIIAPVVAVMFAASQESSRTFYQHSEASRTPFSWSWHLKEKGTRRIWICLGREFSPLDLAFSQPIVPTLLVIFSNKLCLYLSPTSSSLAWAMPTNQSSPWNVGNPQHCSNAEKITTTSKPPKVPYSQASIELARSKEQAKPLACTAASVSPSRLMTVNPSMLRVWEKKTTEGQFTTVPHVSSNMPQQLNGIQILKPILTTGLSETNMVTRDGAPSSIQKKECQVGLLAS